MAHTPDLGRRMTPRDNSGATRFYHLATWLYHGGSNAWTWSPSPVVYSHDLDRVKRLVDAGYAQVPSDSINPSLLTLHGQMCEVITLSLPGGKERELWARQEDLARLESVPVALAFTLPDELEDAWKPLQESWPSSTSEAANKIVRVAQRVPPPQFGECALVLRDGSDWQTRTVAALGEQGRAIQDRMAAALRDLADPAGWRPWVPELELCQDQAQYERLKTALQGDLLAKRGEEREHVREQLELLEAVRAHALDIQTQAARQAQQEDTWLRALVGVTMIAHELADLYWQVEQEAERHTSKRVIPDIPSVFDGDNMAQVPSMMPVPTVLNAFSAAPKGWTHDDDGIPTYRQTTRDHDTIVQVRGEDQAELLDDARLQQLWQQVGELSDLDGDVFLAMLAQYIASPADPDGVWISAAQILDYRGVEPMRKPDENNRRAGHRQEDLMSVARCIARQASQWVRINSVIIEDATSGKRKQTRINHVSRLTQIAEVIYAQELMPEPDQPGVWPIAWRFRIGTWLNPFLSGPNRKIALLCQQALHYDPYHEQWEKRLARYSVFQLRINGAKEAQTIKRNIGRLIDELSLSVDERNPERTRRRFDQAMDRLRNDGVIDGWSYAKSNPALPARKWLATWRAGDVLISAGAVTVDRQAQLTTRARTRRERGAALGQKGEGKKHTGKGRK